MRSEANSQPGDQARGAARARAAIETLPPWRPSPGPGALRTQWRALGKAAIAPVFALLLALLEAFGFQQDNFLLRFGFWATMMLAWVSAFALSALIIQASPRSAALPLQRQRLLVMGLTVASMAVIAERVANGAFGWGEPTELLERMGQALLVGGGFELLCLNLLPARASKAPPARDAQPTGRTSPAHRSPSPEAAPTPVLLRRLPSQARGQILCLNMEDHYVRVHTARATLLVLMRFSDAVGELEGLPGLRVHRSWWVAEQAIVDVERSARSTKVRLTNGQLVPVSQPYVQSLLQAVRMRPPAAPLTSRQPSAASAPQHAAGKVGALV